MTGEGIHTAMESGKIAASVLKDAFAVGNFDASALKEYQNRWLDSFGYDFYWYSELNYCVYIIPGNPLVTDGNLPYWHEYYGYLACYFIVAYIFS